MKLGIEIIEFKMMGLTLQEPMALITNWILATFSFFAYYQLKNGMSQFQDLWKKFYLTLGISMFFGGMGHLFYQYTGIPGKFPSWILGIAAGIFASLAMISLIKKENVRYILKVVLFIKSFVLLNAAIYTYNFFFVAIDTSLTYLFYCGYLAIKLHKKNWEGIKFMYLGVLILLPSALIFGLRINLHRWLNKDDLSHLLMLGCIVFFFIGVRTTQRINEHRLTK